MCGRYAFATSQKKLEKQFKVGNLNGEPPKNYNVAPSQAVPILRMQEDKRCELSLAHWGLVPFWAKDKKMAQYTINARAETIREKPSFRHCIRRQRCIVPASGFFEWHTLGQLKQTHYISMSDQSLMAMAGLWDKWEGPEGILRILHDYYHHGQFVHATDPPPYASIPQPTELLLLARYLQRAPR